MNPKGSDTNMSFKRQALIMVGNAVIGLFTCYLYLYFWIAFSFNGSIISIEALMSLLISLLVFGVFNALVIKEHKKVGWIYAATTYIGTIALFILIFSVS
ncbi:hypothetical protein [Pontibacillus sp. HMF3514]|uniref:DUF6903 family protein n=1 Tax=Pontibacillus sp. HMF3514 TaxID=2692425 RepID=UPI00131FDBEE|nr:hypothetical protein [Pontibacillus sp. HMF3514]QHE52132.1 hypothetical protein GS400_08865 [Pontibacillus sp. HMF3514]